MQPIRSAKRVPWSIVVAAALLVALGWLGVARSEELRRQLSDGLGGRFLRQQVIFSGLAAAVFFALLLPSYRVFCRYGYAIFVAVLGLLLVVYLFPPINGSHRWIRVGPVGLQPSEFAKVAFVLALARYLMYRENHRRLAGLAAPLAIALVPVLLILKEPDLGTAAVFLPVLLVMLFVAGARRADLVKVGIMGLLLVPLLWTQMSREQRSRVTALAEPTEPGSRPSDDAYHLYQAKRTLALGGAWGSLLAGQPSDDPAVYHLPEARSDFIFCALGERLGLWGLGLVLGTFGVLVWRGMTIAAETREPFGRLVAAGISAMFAVEVLVNTGMTVGLTPVTGLSLPLVGYGGSGLLAHAIGLGLVANVGMRPGYELGSESFRYAVA